MHFCKANVAIGGDNRNIATRDAFAPVSWPEVMVLREIHGAEAVTEVEPFVDVKQTAKAERERLSQKYGEEVLGQIWGGKNAPSELTATGAKLKADVVWFNPLSNQTEKTTKIGSEPYTSPPELRSVAEIVGNYAVRDDAAGEDEVEESDAVEEEPAQVEDEEDPTEEPKKTTAKKK